MVLNGPPVKRQTVRRQKQNSTLLLKLLLKASCRCTCLDRLRQISPLTLVLICAATLTLGLSLWPYIAPLFIPSSDDRWQADMEIRLSQFSTDIQMLSDQQAAPTRELQAVQDNLSGLDQQIKNTASSVVQFRDSLIKDIERLIRNLL